MKLDFELEYGKCFEILKKYIKFPVVIAGYGVNAKLFMGIMAELNIPILAVCDKNKVGQDYQYVVSGEIRDYEYLKNIKTENYQIVIASEEHYESIKKNIMVYENEKEILNIEQVAEIRKSIPLIYQLSEPFLYKKYLKENMDRLNHLNDILEDELSRKTLLNVIKTRCSWNEKYVKEIKVNDMYYIPELNFGDNEIFLDGGAYDGDTAKEFITYVNGRFNKIYCIEPNIEKHIKINELASKYETGKTQLIPQGISDKKEMLYFAGKEKGYCISDRGIEVPVTTVDLLDINPTFMKYDIQGEELKALKGAEKTIRKFRPKMAICVYHKDTDLLDVAEFIWNLRMNYKIILRHHAEDIQDTVLYAI